MSSPCNNSTSGSRNNSRRIINIDKVPDSSTTRSVTSFDVVPSPNENSTGAEVFESDSDSLIKIPIIGFEVMEERARFTVFKLRVENEKLNETWLVFRRYTDFERLNAKIREEFPHLKISFPPKRWIRDNFENGFLEDRMKGLQAFIDSILIRHKLTDSATVREFFCLDEPPLYPENAEESRAMYGSLEETIVQLKDVLNAKQTEIQILRAQLALANTQHENFLRHTKSCRHCGRRSSIASPNPSSAPAASSTPTSLPMKTKRRNPSSDMDRRSLPASGSKLCSSDFGYLMPITPSKAAEGIQFEESCNSSPEHVRSSKEFNGVSSAQESRSSSLNNSDFGSISDHEPTNSLKSSKDTPRRNVDNKKQAVGIIETL